MPKITVLCSTCGAAVSRWPFQVRNNTSGLYFCSNECDGAYKRVGERTRRGYVRSQFSGDRILEHRRIVEQALGRKLLGTEVVHHVNGDKMDNRIENLAVMTQAEHMREHKPLSFDIGLAERLIAEGVGLEDVAQRLGVTTHTIEAAFARRGRTINAIRGLPARARVAYDFDKIIELAKDGRTIQHIADVSGTSTTSIKRFLKKRGLTVGQIRAAA